MGSPGERTPSVHATNRSDVVQDNVWQWIHHVEELSPVQPISNLGTGFNEHSPPDFLVQEHSEALKRWESNQYAPVAGSDDLKMAISEIYSPLYGRTLDPASEIIITSGAQEGLLSCVMTFIEKDDQVILLEPVFAMYVYQITFAGGVIRHVPLRPPSRRAKSVMMMSIVSGNDWTLDLKELEAAITPRTKMIYLNNPHNPLGKVFTRDELLGIGNLCVKYNLVLLSDEVYERVVFKQPVHCPQPVPHTRIASVSPEIAERTLTAVSLGKLFNATGWRVGFVIGPAQLMKPLNGTHLILAYSSSTPAQNACAVGLRLADQRDWWSVNATDICQRIQILCKTLEEIGLSYVAPAGAWFIFVDITALQIPDGYDFPDLVKSHGTRDWQACYFLVQEMGISSIPGSCFYGPDNLHLGAKYLRFGACKSDEGLALARERLLRLKPFLRQHVWVNSLP